MRDLHAVGAERAPLSLELDLDTEPAQERVNVPEIERQIRGARRDQQIAGVAVMLLDAAKMVEPIVELLCDRALRWASLGSFVGLTFYALRDPSWERAAICGAFATLAPWVIRAWRT